MKRPEALLCLGVAVFVFWVLLAITYPWLGFALGVIAFVVLISFMFFLLMCYAVSRRPRFSRIFSQ
jgi:hypothetical protein